MTPPNASHHLPRDLQLLGTPVPGMDQILTPEALGFVAMLQRKFADRISTILQCRRDTQHRYDRGQWPNFPKETAEIRAAEWRVAPIPADLRDRRVEITGPVSRKMVINALNSGANVFMADFEDATSPTWANLIDGQVNLRDAVNRTITFEDVKRGKHYALGESTATLMVRPRGLHLPESHVTVAGAPVHASLFDFGLYFFHNAKALIAQGTGPYFYLPKLQHYLEARVWNDIFVAAQDHLGIPQGSIRATVLIETLSASFQMDEILWELRDHSAGLNCGRWDYIFSYIKTMQAHRQAILPDRSEIGMTQPFMSAYTQRVIQVCHRRGVHAMGGMAAQIPIKNDPEANDIALDKVREDKRREVLNGHDGTWVAHPALVAIAREVFDAHMPRPNQIDKKREDVDVSASDLLRIPEGRRTQEGLRHNLRIGVQYLEAWLRGNGCVPLYNLMEDAATAEISRTQVWQWVHHEAVLEDGSVVTAELVQSLLVEEMAILRARHAEGQFAAASALFLTLATQDELTEFLTLPAYEHIVTQA